jgi:hypothetical protein
MPTEKVYFWPQWFATGLSLPAQHCLSASLISKLGRATSYLWRALNIYDDFLDGEGKPASLPVANRYYRHFLEIYYRLDLPPNFYKLFRTITDDLDQANRQEVLQPRIKIIKGRLTPPPVYPPFTDLTALSRKSLALSLGPLAIIFTATPADCALSVEATLNFFRSALAAKQLADDAQDWLDDLKSGVITAANVLVLQAAVRRHLILDLERRPAIVYLLFAQEASLPLSSQLTNLCQQARAAANQIALSPDSRLIQEIIAPLERGLAETVAFRASWLKTSGKML